MDPQALVVAHTAISLVAIAAGFVVLYGMLNADRMERTTLLFLVTTIATSASGYLFQRSQVLPSHIVGGISLALLAAACFALYRARLSGAWRAIYVVTAVASLYLNVFVLVVQAFLKIAPLRELAPQGKEPPFVLAQGIVFVAFLALGWLAVKRFRVGAAMGQSAAARA